MAEKKSVSVKVLNMAGAEVKKINLAASVFAVEPHKQAMFNAVQVEQANSRQATAKNKKEHQLALRSALSLKTPDNLVVVDEIKFADKKTKEFVKMLQALKSEVKTLVVVEEIDENLFASVRNVAYAKVVTTDNVSVYDLLNADKLVMSEAAVKEVEEALK